MPATPENPPTVPALRLPRIVSTSLLFVVGALSTPVETASAFGVPAMLAQRSVDSPDPDPEGRGAEWDRESSSPASRLDGAGGRLANGGFSAGRGGLAAANDGSPVVPSVLPAVPANLPKRNGNEPQGDGGATARPAPAGNSGNDLRLQMREYGTRFDQLPRGVAGSASGAGSLREAAGDSRWLDADERTSFREALRERHRRTRH